MIKRILFLVSLFFLLLTAPSVFAQAHKSNLLKGPQISSLSLNVNALGFAQLGPVVQVEISLGNNLCLAPWLRFAYAGAASQYLWTDFQSDRSYFAGSGGFGLGLKKFFSANHKKNLFYGGLFGEYSYDKAWYDQGSEWESERVRSGVAVLGNFGYRWVMKNNFYLGLGIFGGVSIDMKDQSIYIQNPHDGEIAGDYTTTRFVGIMEFTLGWELKP